MARTRPSDRFDALVRAAAQVIVAAGGIGRTQMSEVARAMGVAKGTLYLLVESKEALFDVVMRHGDDPGPIAIPDGLPVRTPTAGATLALLAARLEHRGRFAALDVALAHPGVADPAAELQTVIEDVYGVLARNRVAIRILNLSAREAPELAAFWFDRARGPLHDRLTALLARGVQQGGFRPLPDTGVAARMIIETCMWFAVHRAWDARPDGVADETVKATVVQALVRGIAG
jgi:AcrR family transcriptional regulator